MATNRLKFGTIKQASKPTITFTWPLDSTHTPSDLTGFTITGTMYQVNADGATTAISGTLSVTDGAARTCTWAMSAADTGTVGVFKVTFLATDGSDSIYTLFGDLEIELNPSVTGTQNDPLVSITSAQNTWLTTQVANGEDVADKANLVSGGTTDNLVSLTAGGDMQDSGFSGSSFDAAGSAAAAQAAAQTYADTNFYNQSAFSAAPVAAEPLKADGGGGLSILNFSFANLNGKQSATERIRIIAALQSSASGNATYAKIFPTNSGGSFPFDQFGNMVFQGRSDDNARGSFAVLVGTSPTVAFGVRASDKAVMIGNNSPQAQFHATVGSASRVGQIIQLASSATANAFEVQDSGGGVLASVDKDGGAFFGSSVGIGVVPANISVDVIGNNAAQFRMANTTTDDAIKNAYWQVRHYSNEQKDVLALLFQCLNDSNALVNIGGGSAALNAVTAINLFTAPDSVTVTGTNVARFDNNTTAGNTRFLIYDVDNATLERVSVGAADSGGAGFKVLRIPN